MGGAIYINGLSTFVLSNSYFKGNYANQNGGAIYASGYEYIEIYNTEFTNNHAEIMGSEYYGLYSSSMTNFTKVNITNPSNVSSLYCDSIALTANYLNITSNTDIFYF